MDEVETFYFERWAPFLRTLFTLNITYTTRQQRQ
jgi:hypothetical protein